MGDEWLQPSRLGVVTNRIFPVPLRSQKVYLASSKVTLSPPASALNLVLSYGTPLPLAAMVSIRTIISQRTRPEFISTPLFTDDIHSLPRIYQHGVTNRQGS